MAQLQADIVMRQKVVVVNHLNFALQKINGYLSRKKNRLTFPINFNVLSLFQFQMNELISCQKLS